MALYGAFATDKHFSELDDPLPTQEGVLTPTQRRNRALANLFGGQAPSLDGSFTFTGTITIDGATGTGADTAGVLTLTTPETTVVDADQLGRIDFQAPAEASGTDAILVAASIWAEADDTFAAAVNATDLVFALGNSEVAAEKFRMTSDSGFQVWGPVGTGAASAGVINLRTAELTVVDADQLGRIDFQAPLETGADAILVAASIWAEADVTFDATNNATDLVIALGVSEAAAEKWRLKSNGVQVTTGIQMAAVAVPNGASYSVLAADSGKVHVVADQGATLTMTLPAHAAGLNYEFWYGGAAADASGHRLSCSGSGVFVGGVTFHDEDGDVSSPVYSNGSSNDFLDLPVPAGYIIKVVSNGTNWLVNGWLHGATTAAFADA